jgi:hypothetical protein
MVNFWQILFYMLFAVVAIFICRLILHLLILLLSKRKNKTLKLRVAEDYDFIEGWKAESDDSNIDSDGKDVRLE